MTFSPKSIIVLAIMMLASFRWLAGMEQSNDTLFRQRVAPVFVSRCLACHGTQKQEGGYSLSKLEELFQPGDSGEKPIVAGEPESSELLRRLNSLDPDERMPSEGAPLSHQEIAAVRAWIVDGAKLPGPGKSSLAEYSAGPSGQSHAPRRYAKRLPISALAASLDGSRVFASGYAEITVWDTANGQLAERIALGWPFVADIEILPDGQWLAASMGVPGQTGVVQLIPIHDSQPAAVLASSSDVFPDMVVSPDGKRLCIGGADGTLTIIDVETRRMTHRSTPHADRVNAVAWSADGQQLLTASHDRTAKLFNAQSLSLTASFDRHDRSVGGAAFLNGSPITGDESGKLQIWASDGTDRSVAEKSGLARFAHPLCAGRNEVLVPYNNSIRRFSFKSKEVDAGKDDNGQPKKKTIAQIDELPALRGEPSTFILSLTSTPGGLVFAGTDRGEILCWENRATEPALKFVALPR